MESTTSNCLIVRVQCLRFSGFITECEGLGCLPDWELVQWLVGNLADVEYFMVTVW